MAYGDLSGVITLNNYLYIPTAGPLFSLFSQYRRVEATAVLPNGTTINVSWTYETTNNGNRVYDYDGSPNTSYFQHRLQPYNGQTAKLTLRLFN